MVLFFTVVLLLYTILIVGLLIGWDKVANTATSGARTEEIITILVPARNEASNISSLLCDLQKLEDSSYEVIVIDDHSDDDSGGYKTFKIRNVPNAPLPVETMPQDRIPNAPWPDTQLPLKTMPQNPIPNAPWPNTQLPVKTMPQGRIPNNPLPNNPIPSEPWPDEFRPIKTMPRNTIPRNRIEE